MNAFWGGWEGGEGYIGLGCPGLLRLLQSMLLMFWKLLFFSLENIEDGLKT